MTDERERELAVLRAAVERCGRRGIAASGVGMQALDAAVDALTDDDLRRIGERDAGDRKLPAGKPEHTAGASDALTRPAPDRLKLAERAARIALEKAAQHVISWPGARPSSMLALKVDMQFTLDPAAIAREACEGGE